MRELTPSGRGAVRVLEVAGPDARALAARVLDAVPEPGGLRIAAVVDERGERIDEAVVLCDPDGRVELQLTGSPPLVRGVLARLGGTALPPAAESLEERAAALLADAPCEAAARILLDQAEGALRRELEALRDATSADDARARAEELAARARIAEAALRPRTIALAGPVNAGKSTLFNLLVAHERVVVSEEPGTTRDVVRAPARLGAWPVVLVDTAGERDAPGDDHGRVEAAGQRLADRVRRTADLVLRLVPADGAEAPPAAGPDELRVLSRADRRPAGAPPAELPTVSAHDAEASVRTVATLVRERWSLPEDPWIPGAGVPFEPRLAATIERLVGATAAERVALVNELLVSQGPRGVAGALGMG